MKRIIALAVILLASLMTPSTSHAEWLKAGTEVNTGDSWYIHSEIKRNGGYVYFWPLIDSPKRSKEGLLSSKMYLKQTSASLPKNLFLQ